MFSLILMFVTLASVGNMLTFMVGLKQAFEVSLADVADTVDLSLMNHWFMFVMADHICMS